MSGLVFEYLTPGESMDAYEVTERLALTEPDEDGNQRVVPEDDPAARWLWAVPGQQVPLEEAKRYGLSLEPKTVAASEPDAAEAAPAEKPKRTARRSSRAKTKE